MRFFLCLLVALFLCTACAESPTESAPEALPDGFLDEDGGQAPEPDGEGQGPEAAAPDMSPEATPDVVEPEPAPGPELPEYSGGVCPSLDAGRNNLQVLDRGRDFDLYLPPEPEGAPVLIIWHWLGGSAAAAGNAFGAQQIADTRGWIVVVPESCCSSQTEWGYPPATQATEQDLTLFDDLLACVGGQYQIDRRRIYITGFSAGSLWSSYLVLQRSEYLAGAAIFSGGLFAGYQSPVNRLPVLLVDGGPTDVYGGAVNFHTMTQSLSDNLTGDGHFVVHCVHTLGHRLPVGATAWGLDFLEDHTFAQEGSPLEGADLGAAGYPAYCEIP